MNYIANSKNRKLKNKISALLARINFRAVHFSIGKKIILVGTLLWIVSLFFCWTSIANATWSSFSLYSGLIWYIAIVPYFFILLSLFSASKIHTIKTILRMKMSEWHLALISGCILLCSTIIVMNMSLAMGNFIHRDAAIGNGLIFGMIWNIFIIIGGIRRHNEEKKEVMEQVYIHTPYHINNTSQNMHPEHSDNRDGQKKTNMTLPF